MCADVVEKSEHDLSSSSILCKNGTNSLKMLPVPLHLIYWQTMFFIDAIQNHFTLVRTFATCLHLDFFQISLLPIR